MTELELNQAFAKLCKDGAIYNVGLHPADYLSLIEEAKAGSRPEPEEGGFKPHTVIWRQGNNSFRLHSDVSCPQGKVRLWL